MSGMPANAVRYFLAVNQAGTFRHASDLLHVSASAINRQISLLEMSLGAPVFERGRGRNKLKLTSAGKIFLAHARTAANAMEQARSEIREHSRDCGPEPLRLAHRRCSFTTFCPSFS